MKVNVPGMSCKHCEMRVTKALNEIGIEKVKVNLQSKDVDFDLGNVREELAIKAIEDSGYEIKK